MGVFSAAVRGLLDAKADPETIIRTIEAMEQGCLRFSIARTPEEKPEPKKEDYSEEFDRFWLKYPERKGMSKKEAWDVWRNISAEERRLAIEALPKFVEYIAEQRKRNPSLTVVHACRYLSKRRGESLLEAETAHAVLAGPVPVFVDEEDDRWPALRARYQREKGKSPPLIQGANGKRGWHFAKELVEEAMADAG